MAKQQQSLIDFVRETVEAIKSKTGTNLVDELENRYELAKTLRAGWDPKWSEINRLLSPAPQDFSEVGTSGVGNSPPSKGITTHCSAVVARVNKIVSMLDSMIADPSERWFESEYSSFTQIGKLLNRSITAIKWLKARDHVMMALFNDPRSNFYPTLYMHNDQNYRYGTGYIEVLKQGYGLPLSYTCPSVNDCYISVDGNNQPLEIYRRLTLNARQAMGLFGNYVSESLQMEVSNMKSGFGKHEFVEMNIPNPFVEEMKKAKIPVFPYLSIVIEQVARIIVSVKQYPQLPYVVSRFDLAPNELYGRSYVWDAMPDIKNINELERLKMVAMKMGVEPPVLATPAIAKLVNRIAPRTIIPVLDPATGSQSVFEPFNYGVQPQMLLQVYQLKLQELDDVLVSRDVFAADIPGKTAFEVNERKIQLQNRLRPMIVRLESQALSKLIELTSVLLEEQNCFDMFPYEAVANELGMDPLEFTMMLLPNIAHNNIVALLARGIGLPNPVFETAISFRGQLDNLRRLQDIVDLERVLQLIGQALPLVPDAADYARPGQIVKKILEYYARDETVIATEEEIKEKREARANQVDLSAEKLKADIAKENMETNKIQAEIQKIEEELV
jgi:hypothetical protein